MHPKPQLKYVTVGLPVMLYDFKEVEFNGIIGLINSDLEYGCYQVIVKDGLAMNVKSENLKNILIKPNDLK